MSTRGLVAVDLDNTLYDWVDFYIPAFESMVDELERITGISREKIYDDFQRLHKENGTAEYAFALQELEVLPGDTPRTFEKVQSEYGSAIEAFHETASLELYDGVDETLSTLADSDITLVAYTDAFFTYASSRLRDLGIEEHFDGLVAPQDHKIPAGTTAEDVKNYHDFTYDPDIEYTQQPESDELKPQPGGLNMILSDWGVSPKNVIYVGDSLYKDVVMAKRAGVIDVYAEYGGNQDPELIDTLVSISHWSDAEVERSQSMSAQEVDPSFTISSFSELLDVVDSVETLPNLDNDFVYV